jgi:glycosyltransferase involved in cell wall biosynthesis
MKVLFVFSHPAPYKIDLFNELAPHIDLTVVFERQMNRGRHPFFYEKTDFKFRAIFLKGLNIGKENHLSFELIKHIKKNTYDLIIMNGYSSMTEIITIFYLQKHKIPYVLYVNGGVIHRDPKWRKWLKDKLVTGASYYAAPSPVVDEYLIHYGADKKRIRYYPYSTIYDHEVIKQRLSPEKRNIIKKSLGLRSGPLFVSAGQFIERKNYMALLELWRLQPKNYQLLLIGSGKEESKYRQFISHHRLNNVTLINFQRKEKLLEIFRASDGFILLSKEDIYGHVVNEALSQGIGVICSDRVIAGKHLIKDGESGYLVNNGSTPKLLEKIDDLLKRDFCSCSLATAKANTIEKMATNHLAMFKEFVS